MSKYFGTDGIRGKYGDNLDAALSYKTGRAVAEYFGEGSAVVGRDTRISGPEIQEALIKGLTDGGVTVLTAGILPTPAISHLAIQHKALCGIVISASHNPPEYNGIKIFDGNGVKLSEEQEGSIEYYIDNEPTVSAGKGKVVELTDASEDYIKKVVETVNTDFTGMKVLLDCGYGASGTVARQCFERLNAEVIIENCSQRGEKINAGCGALYPTYVKRSMQLAGGVRLGFAFDGDADRLSVVYDGEIIDGDSVLYNISKEMPLKDNVVVGTILTNYSLEQKLNEEGKRLIRTPVGDKYICDLMFRKGYNLGGEQSGHFIVYPASTTGDGIMSAMFFCKAVYKKGKYLPISKLSLTPQKAISEFADPSIMYDKQMQKLIDEYTEKLYGLGRLVVRMSGTEPKIRVMCECSKPEMVDEVLKVFRQYILNRKND